MRLTAATRISPSTPGGLSSIFHAVRHLAIVLVVHASDMRARPGNRHGPLFHAATFYGTSLALGAALFLMVSTLYVLAVFDAAASVAAVLAAVNLHHFVVGGFIWRTRSARRGVD